MFCSVALYLSLTHVLLQITIHSFSSSYNALSASFIWSVQNKNKNENVIITVFSYVCARCIDISIFMYQIGFIHAI